MRRQNIRSGPVEEERKRGVKYLREEIRKD